MTFEAEKPHIYAHGTTLHLLDVMFIEDWDTRCMKVAEWQDARRQMPEPTYVPVRVPPAPTTTWDDLSALMGRGDNRDWDVDDHMLAGLLSRAGLEDDMNLEDALLAEFEAYVAEPVQDVQDVPVKRGVAGIAVDDPLYQLTQLVPEDGHGRQ